MNHRWLGWTMLVASVFALAGLLGVDRPLAEGVRASGLENLGVFVHGLAALDTLAGIPLWFWLAACVAIGIGVLGLLLRRTARWPRAFLVAGVVQLATLHTMILGKSIFGRLRPEQVLAGGDWSQVWYAGGGSFPSGHSAFYFGLLLPLAAACPRAWQRVALVSIALFAVLARIDMAKHFLSDVATSAGLAAAYALLALAIVRRVSGDRPAAAAAPAPT